MLEAREFLEDRNISPENVFEYLAELPLIQREVLEGIIGLSDKQYNRLIVAGARTLRLIEWLVDPEKQNTSRAGVLSDLRQSFLRIYTIYRNASIGGGIVSKSQIPTKYQWRSMSVNAIDRLMKEYRNG